MIRSARHVLLAALATLSTGAIACTAPQPPRPSYLGCHAGSLGQGYFDIEVLAEFGRLGNARKWNSTDGTCSGNILGAVNLVRYEGSSDGVETANLADAACKLTFAEFGDVPTRGFFYRYPGRANYPTLPMSTVSCSLETE
jgi:hypothetical protein